MSYSAAEFEAVYKGIFPIAMRLAVRMLQDEDEARDIVQEVFLKLWKSEAMPDNAGAFVVRAVRNSCLNRLSAIDIREKFAIGYIPEFSDVETQDERQDALRHAVETVLTPAERSVVELIYRQGNSYKDAAAALHVSVAAVNKRVVNALKRLRNHFNIYDES